MAISLPGQLKEGFWIGLGFAAAFAVWALLQMLMRRAEGH